MVVTTFDLILAAQFKKIKTCSFSFLSFFFHVSCVHQPQMSRELPKTSIMNKKRYKTRNKKKKKNWANKDQ